MTDQKPEEPYSVEEEERFRKIEEELTKAASVEFALPSDDVSLDDRLKAFESRARAAQRRAEPVVSPGGTTKKGMAGTRDTGVAIAIAYNLLGCVIGGWAIGFLIDQLAHTNPMGQGIGALVGAVAGVTAAVVLALRAESTGPK